MQAYGLKPEDWNKSALTVVVVGASGDLARKKIFPAMFALYHEGMLPEVSQQRSDLAEQICTLCNKSQAAVACTQQAMAAQPCPLWRPVPSWQAPERSLLLLNPKP